MKLAKALYLLVFCFGLSACDKQIQNYVAGARPKTKEPAQSSSSNAIKISPGRLEATSSDISAEANITPNRKILNSADVSARIGVSRTRVTNQ